MHTLKHLHSLVTALTLAACAASTLSTLQAQTPAAETTTSPKAQHFQTSLNRSIQADYLLHLPKDYKSNSEKRFPLIFFLHGAGERGSDVQKVAVHGPLKVAKQRDLPFILVAPQCPDGETWSNDTLLALLDEVTAKYQVDTNRIYLTGLSMGGFGTWSLGTSHPERFAALAPVCGGGDIIQILLTSRTKNAAIRSLGIWAFHGAKDPVVLLSESERMVAAMKRAGCPEVQLTVYPEAQHDSWTEAYNNPELYDWFLKHERKKSDQ